MPYSYRSLLAAALLGVVATACDVPTAPEIAPDAIDVPGTSQGTGSVISGEVRIALNPGGAYVGSVSKAKYKNIGGERELQIEIENGPRDTSLSFLVGGTAVAAAVTDGFGNVQVDLNSDAGSAVPLVTVGTRIEIRAAGVVVASGSF